jgi:integrase
VAKRIYHPKDKELYQRTAGGNFYIYVNGQDHSLGTDDYFEARKKKEYHKAIKSTYGAASFSNKFGDLIIPYFDYLDGTSRRASYIASIKWYWNKYLKSYWENKRLVDFDQIHWDEFCAKTKRKFEVSDFTNHRSTMTGFLNWARGRKFILSWPPVENPDHTVRKRKIIPPDHLALIFRHAPTVQDWRADLAERNQDVKKYPSQRNRNRRDPDKLMRFIFPGGLRLFLAFYLLQGMRRKEITEMEISRINFKRKSVILLEDHTKTREGREIPLNVFLEGLILERLQLFDELGIKTNCLFPNARDLSRPMTESGFKTTWAKVLEAAELKQLGYTWHDFRATFETAMAKSKNFTDAQKEKMAGASLDVQHAIYVSMGPDDLRGLENIIQIPEKTEEEKKESEGLDGKKLIILCVRKS